MRVWNLENRFPYQQSTLRRWSLAKETLVRRAHAGEEGSSLVHQRSINYPWSSSGFSWFSPCSGSADQRNPHAIISRLAILMLPASLLMIGCDTQQEEQFTPAQTNREREISACAVRDQDGRIQ